MFRIRIHGRGGQGIKMASRVLGTALFRSGFTVQDSPKYGAERRGAPIFSNVRADRRPINERGVIQKPDLVVVADDTLLAIPAAGTLQGLDSDSVILVNSHDNAGVWQHRLNIRSIMLILPIAEEPEDRAELPYIGATCAGAAARLLGVIERDVLMQSIAEELADLGETVVEKNLASALQAFDAMADSQGIVTEGKAICADGFERPQWVEIPRDNADISAPDVRASANSIQIRTGLWRTMRPVIEYDHCNQCWWICSTFCPDSAILVAGDNPVIDYDHCKGCMICVGVCPTHAIEGIPEYLAQKEETESAEGGSHDATQTPDR